MNGELPIVKIESSDTRLDAESTQASGRDRFLLLLLSAAAIAVHGYHPFVEDAEIYVPGIRKLLHPKLYPFNDGFFASHAQLTFFPNLIAWSVRISHFSLEWVLLAWHFACIYALLVACWKLGKLCFGSTRAAWSASTLVAGLLTIPVAGTALYIMDQYVNPRSLSIVAAAWVVLTVMQKKYAQAGLWCTFAVLVHPLMAVFTLIFGGLLLWKQQPSRWQIATFCSAFPLGMFPPVTDTYRRALESHPYFFLLRWHWYEWLGAVAPIGILWWYTQIAHRRRLARLQRLCSTGVSFAVLFLAAGLVVTSPSPFLMRFAELQPMRGLLLIYVLLFATTGGFISETLLRGSVWRWLVLFIPLSAGMFYAQRQLFPATPHLEWPGRASSNSWVQAFRWIRDNTPVNAYFVLNPQHMRLAGEDEQGFRAIAERSRLADDVKDSGVVTMFPGIASVWLQQTHSERLWQSFQLQDFESLNQQYGVDWAVVEQPGVPGLVCPYRNRAVLVCQIPGPR